MPQLIGRRLRIFLPPSSTLVIELLAPRALAHVLLSEHEADRVVYALYAPAAHPPFGGEDDAARGPGARVIASTSPGRDTWAMRMLFGADDHDGFLAARDSLLERFERWLGEERSLAEHAREDVVADASIALDWKWSYADGDLGRWATRDVGEFLLDWCPRKLSVPPDQCRSIPAALATFTEFLGAAGLLTADSSPVAAIAAATALITEEFVAAMGDISNFGLAKSLFGAADADGVDLSDTDQLQAWIAGFNARPEDDRRRVIPDSILAPPPRPTLPPVALPADADVAVSKAAAPILAMFGAFAQFVGAGRKLTKTGNLTLADARALVDLLGTGDVMDTRIGDTTFKTKSAADLYRLRQVFAWAKTAGVVRITHGRVVATKRGLAIAADPAAFFDRAVDALMKIGPLASQRDPTWWLAWPDVTELLDRFVVHLLVGPYVAHRPVPIDDMTDIAGQAVLDTFDFPALDDEIVARHVSTDVVDIIDALELAGIVRRAGLDVHAEAPPGRRRHGGTVELTPAGFATARRLLTEAGYETPTAGRYSDSTAAELLLGTDTDDLAALWGELEVWRSRRPPEQAVSELAAAVRELQDPALQNMALAIMGDIDLGIAEPEVRGLATDPSTRGFALCWLVDHGFEDPSALFDPDDVGSFVDVLAQRLVTTGPKGLCDTLALAGGHDGQVRVIGQLWRSPSVATDTVLAAVGEVHPAKVVAKAARKARFQRRSWLGA